MMCVLSRSHQEGADRWVSDQGAGQPCREFGQAWLGQEQLSWWGQCPSLQEAPQVQRESSAEFYTQPSAQTSPSWWGFAFILRACGRSVSIRVRKLKMGVKLKKELKFQIAPLFLFTLQPWSDLFSLESLNFSSAGCCAVPGWFDVAGRGCSTLWALGNLTAERFPSFA